MSRINQQCKYCINWDKTNKSSLSRVEYWCKDLGGYKEPDDGKNCSYFIFNPNYSGYYITTAVMEICGYNEGNETYGLIKSLRDDYMEHNEASKELLEEYDVVGPIIAKKISNDENKEELSLHLLREFIIPTATCIRIHDYKMAIEKYKTMVDVLKFRYGVFDETEFYGYTKNTEFNEILNECQRIHKINVNR